MGRKGVATNWSKRGLSLNCNSSISKSAKTLEICKLAAWAMGPLGLCGETSIPSNALSSAVRCNSWIPPMYFISGMTTS